MSEHIPMVAVFMTLDGPIDVHPDMPKDQMWMVMQWLMDDREKQSKQYRHDMKFMASLRKARF